MYRSNVLKDELKSIVIISRIDSKTFIRIDFDFFKEYQPMLLQEPLQSKSNNNKDKKTFFKFTN